MPNLSGVALNFFWSITYTTRVRTTSTISFATDSKDEMQFYRIRHPEDEEQKMIHPLCKVCFSRVAYDTEPSCGTARDGGPFQVVSEGPICSMVHSAPESAVSPGTAHNFCLGRIVIQSRAGWKQAVP